MQLVLFGKALRLSFRCKEIVLDQAVRSTSQPVQLSKAVWSTFVKKAITFPKNGRKQCCINQSSKSVRQETASRPMAYHPRAFGLRMS
jgi:hypothetical protein